MLFVSHLLSHLHRKLYLILDVLYDVTLYSCMVAGFYHAPATENITVVHKLQIGIRFICIKY